MLIIDAHLDLAWNALQWNRDLLTSVHVIRALERVPVVPHPGNGRALGTVALPEMRAGRVALCFATLLARSTGHAEPNLDYPSATQAYAVARGQLAYYRALESQGHVRIITDLPSLDQHVAEWTAWDAGDDAAPTHSPPLGFVISMESADPILSPDQLQQWWEAGLRLLGPAHYGPGRYAGGTGTEQGLTELGAPLLSEMEHLGVMLDMTHFSDRAFWQALERFNGNVLASHNNCRALVPHQRQFSDEQLKAIIERDGVVGAAFDAWMLRKGWVVGESSNETVTINTVVDHIDYMCQLAGNSRHVALGTDLDGGFGWEQSPSDLDTIADLQKLSGLLADRGYGEDDVAAILHGNWLRWLRKSWA